MENEYNSHVGGHITLFFTVEKDGRLLRNQGSRGVGINVQHGVSVKLSIKILNGDINDSSITVFDYQGNKMENTDDFTEINRRLSIC